jgi:hypothetical protein
MRVLSPSFLLCLGLVSGSVLLPVNALSQRDTERGVQQRSATTDIATIARDLSDKSQDARNVVINNRSGSPVDLYIALHSFAAATLAYREMTSDGRDETSLRNVAVWLIARAGEVDSVLNRGDTRFIRNDWQLVQEHLRLLSDRFNLTYRGRYMSGVGRGPRAAGGYFKWQGRVDGSDYIMVQGTRVTVRHVEARNIREASYDLPNPFPRRQVTVSLRKLRGRGTVEISQQPDSSNNYTVEVLIEDRREGDDLYEFELTW